MGYVTGTIPSVARKTRENVFTPRTKSQAKVKYPNSSNNNKALSSIIYNTLSGNIKNTITTKAAEFIYKKLKNKIKFSMGIEAYCWNYNYVERPAVEAFNKFLYDINEKKYIEYCYDKFLIQEYKKGTIYKLPFLSQDTEYIIPLEKDLSTYLYVHVLDKETNDDERYINVLYLYFFGRKCYKYKRLLDNYVNKIIEDRENSPLLDIKKYINGSSTRCYRIPKKTNRTVFLDKEIIEDTIDIIKKWSSAKEIFMERELSHKLGILLYGVPGTGKSTFAKYIASELNATIYIPDKTNIEDSMETILELNNIDGNKIGIVLLEDFDYIFTTRDKETNENKKNHDDLLQYLDGLTEINGIIFIATTNKPIDESHDEINKEDTVKLDSALIRDGRFDIKIPMNGISKELAYKMIDSFQLKDPSEALNFVDSATSNLIIPATLQKILLKEQQKEFIIPNKNSRRK